MYAVTLLRNFTLRRVTWIRWLEKDISSTANIFRQVEAFFHSDQKKALFRDWKLYSLERNACHSPKMISFLLYSPPKSVLVLSKSEIARGLKRVHSAAFPTQLSFLHPVPYILWVADTLICVPRGVSVKMTCVVRCIVGPLLSWDRSKRSRHWSTKIWPEVNVTGFFWYLKGPLFR